MLGGGSDGAHNAPDYGEKQAIFMQFAGKVRAQSLHLVYRAAAVTRRAARPAACRRRRRRRSSGGAGSRPSRLRGAAPRGRRGRAAAPAPRTARRCPSEARPSRWCRCRPSSSSGSSASSLVFVGRRRRGRAWSAPSRSSVVARRARRGVAAARVGLALLRERERAADLFLRVRVVEHVGRQLRDRLACSSGAGRSSRPARRRTSRRSPGRRTLFAFAIAAALLADTDDTITSAMSRRPKRRARLKGEGSNHDAERAECPGSRGVWQVSRLALSRW